MIRILIISLLSVVVFACSKTADTPPAPSPTASFIYTLATNGEVAFSNNSQNATSYAWDFGDGSTKITDASPRHVYVLNGKYNVVLTATGAGGSATSTQVVTVSNAPDPKPSADFTFSEVSGLVSFVSTTNYTTSVSWDFGDGTAKSTEASPKHTYIKNQIFTVVLTAIGKGGTTTVTKSVEVKAAPVQVPAKIYITNITITDLEPGVVNKSGDTDFYVLIQDLSYNNLVTTDKFKGPLKAVTTYALTSKDLPFLVRDPTTTFKLALFGTKSFFSIIDYSISNIGQQLKTDGYPTKSIVKGTNLVFELQFKYDY